MLDNNISRSWCYIGWEEVQVRSEKGRREIHYYLKKKKNNNVDSNNNINGGCLGLSDLAVVAKETSSRHMSYRPVLHSLSEFKLRSRRDVLDCLNSLLPDSPSPVSPKTSGGSIDMKSVDFEFHADIMKNTQLQQESHYSKEFMWLGSPWTCKRRKKHYPAFCRNGVKVSVNGFVYVLAEENKRLVAYLDDMYEDAKGNKLVVVRWFHKIDEVGIDLPHNFNDREIFFSLCLQDLSIECIDGLATVLSPQHFTKFQNEAKHTRFEPYMCHRQYDNDELKLLDITQVKGYWNQEVVRCMFSHSSAPVSEKSFQIGQLREKVDIADTGGMKPKKRLRLSRDTKVDVQYAAVDVINMNVPSSFPCSDLQKTAAVKSQSHSEAVPRCIAVGSSVEVLSQDSGMRGCWFSASIVKKHKNKVKLRYDAIKDADNEANSLEEWVLASRIARRDVMGVRIDGRTTLRPSQLSRIDKALWVINIGTIVDVWWHDGWWEGIVIQKDSEEKVTVYFPGEKQKAVFRSGDLRHSRDWVGNTWREVNERPDIAVLILSDLARDCVAGKVGNNVQPWKLACHPERLELDSGEDASCGAKDCVGFDEGFLCNKTKGSSGVDLSKDDYLSQLKWSSSGKRKRSRFSVQKLRPRGSHIVTAERTIFHNKFAVPSTRKVEKENCKPIKVDPENYKYLTDSLCVPKVAPPVTNLVMSR